MLDKIGVILFLQVFKGTESTTGGLYDVDIVNPGENPRLYYVVNTGNTDSPADANITVSKDEKMTSEI